MKTNIFAKAAAITAVAVLAATGFTSPSQIQVSAEDTLPETEAVQTEDVIEQTIKVELDNEENDGEQTFSFDVDPEDAASKFAIVSVANGDVTKAVVSNFDGYLLDLDEIAKDVFGDEASVEEASNKEFFYNDQKIREALSEEDLAEYDEITERIAELDKEMISSHEEAVSGSIPDTDTHIEDELSELYERLSKIVEKSGIDTAVPVNELNVKIDPDSEEVQSYTYFKIIDDSELEKEGNKVSVTTEIN